MRYASTVNAVRHTVSNLKLIYRLVPDLMMVTMMMMMIYHKICLFKKKGVLSIFILRKRRLVEVNFANGKI